MTDQTLTPGSFYWALPAPDPDTDLDWQNQDQPARFSHYDASGSEVWFWLGVSGDLPDGASTWPARWVGKEIIKP